MPTSKQVRARQQRQMERVAEARVIRARKMRRNRIIWGSIAGVALLGLIAAAAGIQMNSDDGKVNAAPPTTEAQTTTTLRAAPKNCTALKDKLPAGAPEFPLAAGAAPTKLVTKDITVGTGAEVTKTSKAKIDYIGVNCSGQIFDSSYNEGRQPFDADMKGGVIDGWLQGIPGMKAGGVRILSIPPALAYGAAGPPTPDPKIPPNEPLFFLVKVNSVS
jgi:peptidylprolyl isomerase